MNCAAGRGRLNLVGRITLALSISIIATAGSILPLLSHGGGLNSEGCHTNRKTGDYHCHRRSDASVQSTPAPPRSFQSSSGRTFANCTAARAAGDAPLLRGEPGYGPHLDRDNDGIACE